MSFQLDEDTNDDILYFARTADIPELLTLLESSTTTTRTSSLAVVSQAKDATTGNTALHYAAANGHTNVILAILATSDAELSDISHESKTPLHPTVASVVAQPNEAGNLALHYAALNGHLDACKVLFLALLPSFSAVTLQTSNTGLLPPAADIDDMIRATLGNLDEQRKKDTLRALEAKNSAGRDAAGEAEGAAKDEIVGWLLGIMDRLEGGANGAEADDGEDETKMSLGDTTGEEVAEAVGEMNVED